MYQQGGGVTGPYQETVRTISTGFPLGNEGMIQAVSPDKIDAYNISLPKSGRLDDLPPEEQQMLRQTPFGRRYLSGDGSLDSQYNAWTRMVNEALDREPAQALSVLDELVNSGAENFQFLRGMDPDARLAAARQLMTDRYIGDWHGAIQFGEESRPTTRMYDANRPVTAAGFRSFGELPVVVTGLGGETLPEGAIPNAIMASERMGIDITQDTPESRQFISEFMAREGSQDRGATYEGIDNQFFINQAKEQFENRMQSRASDAKARAMEELLRRQQSRNYERGGKPKRPTGVDVEGLRAQAARSTDNVNPFRAVHRGYNNQGDKMYDVRYSPLLNALRSSMGKNERFKVQM